MKEYRVSLEVATSLAVTGCEVADVLGVPRSALVEERVKRGLVWRCEPSGGQTGKLEDRIGQLTAEICPRRALPHGGGFRRVSLGIDVLYDTVSCTVDIPLCGLVYGSGSLMKSIPELSSVELTCSRSDEDLISADQEGWQARDLDRTPEEDRKRYEAWKAAGRPVSPGPRSPLVIGPARTRSGNESNRSERTDANRYMVSLDAITSNAATASEVADVLGLPPEAFTMRPMKDGDGAVWRCGVEADQTVGLARRINFLTSRVHPRRPFDPDGEIDEIYLDIGVIYDVRQAETCSVRLPVSYLRSLTRKLFVLCVEVTCYPGGGGDDEDEA